MCQLLSSHIPGFLFIVPSVDVYLLITISQSVRPGVPFGGGGHVVFLLCARNVYPGNSMTSMAWKSVVQTTYKLVTFPMVLRRPSL